MIGDTGRAAAMANSVPECAQRALQTQSLPLARPCTKMNANPTVVCPD